MPHLRRLAPADWPLWREIRLRALAEAPDAFGATLAAWQGRHDTAARWRARLADVALNVVAVEDGRGIGQVSGTGPDEHGNVELISMWVAPESRGAGVGDALVHEVLRWAQRHGAASVTLAVKPPNSHAITLYQRLGFTRTAAPADADQEVLRRVLSPTQSIPE